ncbi:hypothetical protein GXP67_26055 [Rhodocytophaga rosea]|uniref:DUF4468 domain-containing protein n=1 Tax=Rhodocytophaga rosea TaxID=2704465 RepID=A0A6C0GQH4_9BACT|nr:hypothetical protein [Rhodocytophaga rosea]QHT69863.1 hypothetical protein GXP67_26055 [Rhodocytophaga rosea]
MKGFFWIGICIIAMAGRASAQDTAVVASIRQEVRIYPAWRSILSDESFPDYIESDTLWQSSVKTTLQQLLKQKFGVSQVLFTRSNPVTYQVTGNASLSNTSLPATTGDLMVDIYMVINLTTTSMDETGIPSKNFNQTCHIRVTNRENKPVYESTTVVPFRTRVNPETGIYGIAELSATNMKQLFEVSQAAAFAYTSKKLPVRTYDRPAISHDKYKAFLEKAQLFSLEEFAPDVPLQKGQPQQNRYNFQPAKKNANAMKLSLTRNYTGNIHSPEDGYTCRALLTNDFNEAAYQMWATFQWKNRREDSTLPANDEKPEVIVKCFSEGLQLGDFTLSSKKFEGMTGYTSFTIHQSAPRYTLELRLNNQVKALIQKSGVSRSAQDKVQQYYLYLPTEASQEEKAELLTIFMIYKVASEFGQDYL